MRQKITDKATQIQGAALTMSSQTNETWWIHVLNTKESAAMLYYGKMEMVSEYAIHKRPQLIGTAFVTSFFEDRW